MAFGVMWQPSSPQAGFNTLPIIKKDRIIPVQKPSRLIAAAASKSLPKTRNRASELVKAGRHELIIMRL
jgi:hypothetical protein